MIRISVTLYLEVPEESKGKEIAPSLVQMQRGLAKLSSQVALQLPKGGKVNRSPLRMEKSDI